MWLRSIPNEKEGLLVVTDKSTKLLLAAIAIGLWLNVMNPWLRPVPAEAQTEILSSILRAVRSIQSDVSSIKSDVSSIASGLCLNSTIC